MTAFSIQIDKLTKVFPPDHKAIDDLDLSIHDGEIMALLGPNGAGKTTTIRTLSTLCGFDSGHVLVAGFDVDKEPEKVRQSIGVVAQQTGIDYFLTGRENLMLQGHLYHMKRNDIRSRIEDLSSYFELSDSLDKLVSHYSGGMRRKLDIATALIHRPKIIFLDEPTLGLDIRSRKMLWKYINDVNQEFGLTILLTTHYLEEADSLSDRVSIINEGKIQAIGTAEELKRSIQGESVVVAFEQVEKNEQEFCYYAKQQTYVKDTIWDGNNLHLYVEQGAESVPALMKLAAQHAIQVKSLALTQPSLDDVFLKYTGTSMQTEKEDSTEEWWTQWAGKGGSKKWQGEWTSDDDQSSDNNQAEWENKWKESQNTDTESKPDSNSQSEESWGSSKNWKDD